MLSGGMGGKHILRQSGHIKRMKTEENAKRMYLSEAESLNRRQGGGGD